jgi:hypothetical protein
MRVSGQIVAGLLFASTLMPLRAQMKAEASAPPAASESAAELIREVVYNELHDRERDSHWEYRSECTSPSQSYVREQVETANGPIFRMIALDGTPLDAAQRLREDERLDQYIHDPGQIARVARNHQEDEQRLGAAIQLLPQAAIFEYSGDPQDGIVQLRFHPNPDFVPSGIEARIVHALEGTFTINLRFRRMIEMRGVVSERVDFGYGLLGQVEKGGVFEIHRQQVSDAHWKTDLVDIRVQGRILLLKTVGKVQREARSDFRPVAQGTTLEEARAMLDRVDAQPAQARLTPTAVETKRAGSKD